MYKSKCLTNLLEIFSYVNKVILFDSYKITKCNVCEKHVLRRLNICRGVMFGSGDTMRAPTDIFLNELNYLIVRLNGGETQRVDVVTR